MSFKTGDRVVFIPNAEMYFKQFDFPVTKLQNDVIYVVRGIDTQSSVGIYLEGIFNENFCGVELSYDNTNFRKVEDSFGEQIASQIEDELNTEVAEEVVIFTDRF